MRLFTSALFLFLLAAANTEVVSAESGGTFISAGSTLAYERFGNGPVVVVLAGGPGLNARYMAPLARSIAAHGYRAIVLDQRGTGGSVPAGRARAMLTQSGTVADIEALRRTLHEQRLTFVTHSFGGGMALAYAAAYPHNVANMVLIGSVGTDLSTVDRFAAALMTHLSPAERKRYAAAQARNDGSTALDIQLLAEFDDRAKARAVIASEPHPFIYPAVSQAVFGEFARTYHVAAQLRALRAPVTLLTGRDDAAREMEDSLRRALPTATRVYIAHSGHWPWIENPAQFNPALSAALARSNAPR